MKNNKLTIKALATLVAAGIAFTNPATAMTVHADNYVDETDDWNKEGNPDYQDVTEQEQQQHDQDHSNTQDANAQVDNSNGGNPTEGQRDNLNTSDYWENYDPTKDPDWDAINPVLPDNLEDEVDRKTPDIPKTADNTGRYAAMATAFTALMAGVYRIVSSRKKYAIHKNIDKVLKRK